MKDKNFDMKKYKLTTHNLRKMLPLYAEKKGQMIALCVCLFVTGGLGILSPILSANILSTLASSQFDLAIKIAVAFAITALARIIFNGLTDYVYVKINARINYKLTDKLVRSVGDTKMSKLDSVKIGALTERLGADINTIGSTYLNIMDMIFEIITNFAFFIYIAFLNIYMFLILLVYVAVLYMICAYRARLWIRGRKATHEVRDKARSSYIEQINGIRDVKLLNIKDNITNYSNSQNQEAIKLDIKFSNERNILRRVQATVATIFGTTFIILGIVLVNKELLLLTGFLVIYSYYGRVEGLVQYISSLKEHTAEGEISATRVFEVIENYDKEKFGENELNNFSGLVELRDVCFGYSEDRQVLKGINMTFEPGKMTAIVGKSGSGKTTILSLISKLYDIDSGSILLDGNDLGTLTEKSIHSNIGVVSQSPYIFNTTVRQNLLFVKPEATEEEIVSVLKQAQIYDDLAKLDKGIDSEIGENGIKLSGGQKQRIAIARLLLMNSKVIVFDEATSALDNASQNKIVEMLETYKKDKTIIIVAHRLSTIVGADKIYVIEDGKNIADGSHRELMKGCKQYKELYEFEEKNAKLEDNK